MKLSKSQKQEFYVEGYLVVRNVVPAEMIDAARRAINSDMGGGDMEFTGLRNLPVITDLFNRTPIFSLLESAVGRGKLEKVRSGGIILRFPAPLGSTPREPELATAGPPLHGGGHLDGLKPAREFLLGNTEKSGYNRFFTAFAVLYLNDLPTPYRGNFTVWPKSHRAMETLFQEKGHEILYDFMPEVELPEGPVQLTAGPGDVILAHHQIVHSASINTSPDIRYAVIFRAGHVDLPANGKEVFTDIWREWDGIRESIDVARAGDSATR